MSLRLPLRVRPEMESAARILGVSASIYARKLCTAALASEPTDEVLEFIPEPRDPGQNIVATLPAVDCERLALWREKVRSTASDGHFVSGLCLRQIEIGLPDEGAATPQRPPSANPGDSLILQITDAMGQARREHQVSLFSGISHFLGADNHKRVLFAEASTGIGKTRAAIAAAIERVSGHPERVTWIVSPTIAILKQWHAELAAIDAAGIDVPRWRMILGRAEFVSEEGCQGLADEAQHCAEAISAWVDGGALHPDSPRELPPFLAEALGAVLGDEVVTSSARLTQDTPLEDLGAQAYARQFTPDGAQIILMTHAMLATEIRRRLMAAAKAHKADGGSLGDIRASAFAGRQRARLESPTDKLGPLRLGELMAESLADYDDGERRLPDCDHMIVDEAHVLEQSLANALAHNFSFTALLRHADRLKQEAPSLKKAALDHLHSAYRQVTEVTRLAVAAKGASHAVAVQGSAAEPAVRAFHAALREVLEFKRARSFRSANLRSLQMASRALALAFPDGRMGHRAFLKGSPVIMNPQIICGRSEIELEMAWLWTVMAPKSVLISATLTAGEQDLYRVAQRQMHVPSESAAYLEPITPPWLTEPVTLLTPAAGHRTTSGRRFTPPSAASRTLKDATYSEWIGEVAGHVLRSMEAAAGGGLVLANSYADLESLSALLEQIAPIVVTKGTRVKDHEAAFYARCLAGERPLLLATGQAWTGVDIGGHRLVEHGFEAVAPEHDNILTDLFVVRLPFGLNGTVTHLARIERLGLGAEFYSAGQLLKQGIGRLVRRAGLPANRRIHIMDGRLTEDVSANAVRPCKVVMSPYQQRRQF